MTTRRNFFKKIAGAAVVYPVVKNNIKRTEFNTGFGLMKPIGEGDTYHPYDGGMITNQQKLMIINKISQGR